MPRKLVGVSLWRWVEYLIAILLGNAIYYLSFVPHLPESLRHHPFQIDFGLLLDFLACVGVYGLIRLAGKLRKSASETD